MHSLKITEVMCFKFTSLVMHGINNELWNTFFYLLNNWCVWKAKHAVWYNFVSNCRSVWYSGFQKYYSINLFLIVLRNVLACVSNAQTVANLIGAVQYSTLYIFNIDCRNDRWMTFRNTTTQTGLQHTTTLIDMRLWMIDAYKFVLKSRKHLWNSASTKMVNRIYIL